MIDFSGTVGYVATTCGLTFFPELGPNGSIVVFQSNGSSPNGIIFGIDPVTLARTTYASGGILNPAGETDQFCQYSPQQKCVVFGGGEIPRGTKMWKLSAAGAVTLISDNLPSNLGMSAGGWFSLPGDKRHSCRQSASLSYDYDLTTGVWSSGQELLRSGLRPVRCHWSGFSVLRLRSRVRGRLHQELYRSSASAEWRTNHECLNTCDGATLGL
jgi:hypothetical protein